MTEQLVCPDCGELIVYRSCQQPGTGMIAELALWVHQSTVHENRTPLAPDMLGRAFVETLNAREKRGS